MLELERIIADRAEHDGSYAIAYALLRVADQLKWLGNGDAATTMGAIEAHGLWMGERLDRLSGAIEDGCRMLADAIDAEPRTGAEAAMHGARAWVEDAHEE
jgi:hypothetical protein